MAVFDFWCSAFLALMFYGDGLYCAIGVVTGRPLSVSVIWLAAALAFARAAKAEGSRCLKSLERSR